jgi:hypothetical protein
VVQALKKKVLKLITTFFLFFFESLKFWYRCVFPSPASLRWGPKKLQEMTEVKKKYLAIFLSKSHNADGDELKIDLARIKKITSVNAYGFI